MLEQTLLALQQILAAKNNDLSKRTRHKMAITTESYVEHYKHAACRISKHGSDQVETPAVITKTTAGCTTGNVLSYKRGLKNVITVKLPAYDPPEFKHRHLAKIAREFILNETTQERYRE